jgi:hypothetical protein
MIGSRQKYILVGVVVTRSFSIFLPGGRWQRHCRVFKLIIGRLIREKGEEEKVLPNGSACG